MLDISQYPVSGTPGIPHEYPRVFWAAHGVSTRTTNLFPMLSAGSCRWLVNSRETQRRITRLTLSAWDIKTKERHWWRHSVDSDRRPLSLSLQYDRVTLCLYGEIGQINWRDGVCKLRKGFRMWQILFEHGIDSLPLFASADMGI